MMSEEFKDYYNGIVEMVVIKTNNIPYAESLVSKNYFRIKTGFYEDENPNTIVEDLVFQIKEHLKERGKLLLEGVLVESSVTDAPVREIVRTLTNIIKTKETRTYYLSEELSDDGDVFEYNFKNVPEFSIEFNYDLDPRLENHYIIDGKTVDEGYTIEVSLIINPNSLPNVMYDVIADLNDIVSHEIEHIYQISWRTKDEQDPYEGRENERPTGKDYYKQPHEIPAELVGFRRVNKLRKKEPIEKTIKDWFIRNRNVHNLNDEDIKELTEFLTQKYKEKYPNKV